MIDSELKTLLEEHNSWQRFNASELKTIKDCIQAQNAMMHQLLNKLIALQNENNRLSAINNELSVETTAAVLQTFSYAGAEDLINAKAQRIVQIYSKENWEKSQQKQTKDPTSVK